MLLMLANIFLFLLSSFVFFLKRFYMFSQAYQWFLLLFLSKILFSPSHSQIVNIYLNLLHVDLWFLKNTLFFLPSELNLGVWCDEKHGQDFFPSFRFHIAKGITFSFLINFLVITLSHTKLFFFKHWTFMSTLAH